MVLFFHVIFIYRSFILLLLPLAAQALESIRTAVVAIMISSHHTIISLHHFIFSPDLITHDSKHTDCMQVYTVRTLHVIVVSCHRIMQ